MRPSALGREATGVLVRDTLGDEASAELCDACQSATAGNPFLLRCVLQELRDEGILPDRTVADRVKEIHSEAISRATLAQLARLPDVAGELASAIAVLGASCSLADAAAIAGLDEESAVVGADALAVQGLIANSEPLEFVHPIVRRSVYEGIPNHRRVHWHGRAARLLDDEEAPAEEIAVHLLAVAPSGDEAVVGSSGPRRPRRWPRVRRSPPSNISTERWSSHPEIALAWRSCASSGPPRLRFKSPRAPSTSGRRSA